MGKKYSLAIIDPPYGIGVNHNMGRRKGDKPSEYKKAYWDNEAPQKSFFDSLIATSEHQIIWGANHFISQMPFDSPCWVMWDKGFSEDVSFAQFELAWTSFKGTCKKFDKSPADPNRVHATQKPVALYKWLLKNYAKAGDTILDTHGGSMSIVIACIEMGFDIDIWEKDPDYFAAARKRIENHVKQLPLFGPVPTINFFP